MDKQSIALSACALKVETYERILDALCESIAERHKSAGLSHLEDFEKTAAQMRSEKFHEFPKDDLSNQDRMKIVASVFDSLGSTLRKHLSKHAH